MTPCEEWTSKGVLAEIKRIDADMPNRSLAFVLGAGASVSSGILAGVDLASGWLKEIHGRHCLDGQALEAWVASGQTSIDGLTMENIAQYYPQIFEKCFGNDPDSGFAALEQLMERAEPYLGYSLLAEIIDKTRHKVVVTTNFDNLVADALSIHNRKPPLIVGHESLAGFVRPRLRRPLVAKIHRDLMLDPKNDAEGVGCLAQGWADALEPLFQNFTPLFIGYGGNDGSLMGFLNKLPQGAILGRPIWCKRKDTVLPEAVQTFLEKHRGVVCTIEGFNEFMLALVQILIPDFDLAGHCNGVEQLGKQRAEKLRQQAQQIQQAHAGNGPEANESHLKQDMINALKDDSNWWTWEMRAQGEKDPDKRDAIYRKALDVLPHSAELAGAYALFLKNIRKDYHRAEKFYEKSLEIDPRHAGCTVNYAFFLENIRQDYDEAERFYKKAVGLDPRHAGCAGAYATFLANIRKDSDGAEQFFKKSLKLDPNHAGRTGNYAAFLANIRKDYDGAERLYKKALELDPNDANHAGNYCQFLLAQGEQARGKELLKRAFSLTPPTPAVELELWFYGLAHFPAEYPQAEQKIRTLLAEGARSNGWNFQNNIARAETDGHPNIPLLRELADAISETNLHAA